MRGAIIFLTTKTENNCGFSHSIPCRASKSPAEGAETKTPGAQPTECAPGECRRLRRSVLFWRRAFLTGRSSATIKMRRWAAGGGRSPSDGSPPARRVTAGRSEPHRFSAQAWSVLRCSSRHSWSLETRHACTHLRRCDDFRAWLKPAEPRDESAAPRCSYTEIQRRCANRCPKDRRGADSHLQVRTGATPHIVPRHACRGSIPPTRWFVHVCVGTANRLMQPHASISAQAAATWSSSAAVATGAIYTAGPGAGGRDRNGSFQGGDWDQAGDDHCLLL